MSVHIPKINRNLIPLGCKRKASLCFPKANLDSVYLAKKAPLSPDIVLDEYKNGNNASLVQSNSAKFDGATYGVSDTAEAVHTGSELEIEFIGSFDDASAGGQTIAVKVNSAGDREFMIYHPTVSAPYYATVYLYDTTGADTILHFAENLEDGKTFHSKLIYTNGVATTYNVETGQVIDSANVSDIRLVSDSKIVISSYNLNGDGKFTGQAKYLKLGNAEYNFAEGASFNLYNAGLSGGNVVLSGATLSDFWSVKQDIHHYNILNGFSKYYPIPIGYDSSSDVTYWEFETVKFSASNALGVIMFMSLTSILDNGYSIFFDGAGDLVLKKFTDGSATTLGSTTGVDFSSKRIISISRSGAGVFSVKVDGVEVINVTDTDFDTSNYIVYRVYNGEILLSYVKDENGAEYELTPVRLPNVQGNDPLGYQITNPAGKWHNGAETGIQFPSIYDSIVADVPIPQPLFYDDFETDFNNKHQVFSDTTDKKKKSIAIYDVSLDSNNTNKAIKCVQ